MVLYHFQPRVTVRVLALQWIKRSNSKVCSQMTTRRHPKGRITMGLFTFKIHGETKLSYRGKEELTQLYSCVLLGISIRQRWHRQYFTDRYIFVVPVQEVDPHIR